jgi:hypothetical protein
VQAGGPSYAVELGRLDGLVSLSTNVDGKLPPPSFNLDQLTALFAANNLSQADMIALSGKHTTPVQRNYCAPAPSLHKENNYSSCCSTYQS